MARAENGDTTSLTFPLRGKILRIPDLRPDTANGQRESVCTWGRPDIGTMLCLRVPEGEKLDFIKSMDIGLACAMVHPSGGWPEVQAIVAYMVWITLWDDEIDYANSEIATSKVKTEDYCSRSISYIRNAFGLDTTKQVDAPFACLPLIKGFIDPIATHASLDLRKRVCRELEGYMSQVRIEQGRHYDRIIPSPEEYLNTRIRGTIGNCALVMAGEFFTGVNLPECIADSEEMDVIWTEADRHVVIINDIYSMKKEMVSGTAANLVAILFLSNPAKSLDDVVGEIMRMLDASIQSFEGAFRELDRRTKDDPTLNTSMRSCVDFARTEVMAVLEWTIVSGRYQVLPHIQKDGSVEFCL